MSDDMTAAKLARVIRAKLEDTVSDFSTVRSDGRMAGLEVVINDQVFRITVEEMDR